MRDILIKQMYINGVMEFIIFLIICTCLFYSFSIFKKMDADFKGFYGVPIILTFILVAAIAVLFLHYSVSSIFNPEYFIDKSLIK